MATPYLYSDIAADTNLWQDWDPDYLALLGVVGGAAAADRAVCGRALLNLATRTPTVLAFTVAGDEDYVYVGYNPTLYPADITSVSTIDNHLVLMVGNDLQTSIPVVLPHDAFGRTAENLCSTTAVITGPAGHAAGPPEHCDGPHIAGVADTNALRARRAMLMPRSLAPAILLGAVNGR